MTRKECFEFIKANPSLKKKILKDTTWDYQNLKTAELNDYIENYKNNFWTKLKNLFHK